MKVKVNRMVPKPVEPEIKSVEITLSAEQAEALACLLGTQISGDDSLEGLYDSLFKEGINGYRYKVKPVDENIRYFPVYRIVRKDDC